MPNDPAPPTAPSGWAALRGSPRSLVVYLLGTSLSNIGSGFFRLVLPWIVYDLTHSSVALGVLAAVQYLPGLASPWMGAFVDRQDARRVVLWSALGQTLLMATTLDVYLQHRLTLPAVDLAAIAMTALSLLSSNAQNVLIRRATPVGARVAVNALSATVYAVAWYVSPGLAGPIIGHLGIAAALALNAMAYLFILPPALLLPRTKPSPAIERRALGPAWRVLRASPQVFDITAAFMLWDFTWGGVYALEVFYFRHSLHWPASTVGLVGMVSGALPVLLSLISPWIVERMRIDQLLALTLAFSGLGMVLLPFSRDFLAAAIAVGLLDGAYAPVTIVCTTLSQRAVPSGLYGRVNALQTVLLNAPVPAGGALAGLLVPFLGLPATALGLGALTMTGAAAVLRSRLQGMQLGSQRTEEAAPDHPF